MGSFKRSLMQSLILFMTCLHGLQARRILPEAFEAKSPQSMEGPLRKNYNLCMADRLFEGLLLGPVSLAVKDGAMYTGLQGGHIVKIEGNKITPVAKTGKECEGPWEEERCGRPIGICFDKEGNLIVADAYYGLYKFDPNTGNGTILVSSDDRIGKRNIKPGLLNGVTVSSDDYIYYTDSTTVGNYRHAALEFIGDASGRLLRYNMKTGANEELLSGLRFPDAIQLSPDEEHLLITETGKSRIIKYFIRGTHQGEYTTFADRLPGVPAGIKSNGEGGYFVSLMSPRNPSYNILSQRLGQHRLIRGLLYFLTRMFQGSHDLQRRYGPTVVKKIVHEIDNTEMVSRIAVARSVIVELDEKGEITRSFQCPPGDIRYISEMIRFGDYYYLASPFNNFIGRIKVSSLTQ